MEIKRENLIWSWENEGGIPYFSLWDYFPEDRDPNLCQNVPIEYGESLRIVLPKNIELKRNLSISGKRDHFEIYNLEDLKRIEEMKNANYREGDNS